MKKKAIVFGIATLALAASPIFGMSVCADDLIPFGPGLNIGGNDDGDDDPISFPSLSYVEVIDGSVTADLTGGKHYTFTGAQGEKLEYWLNDHNDRYNLEPTNNLYCGYFEESWLSGEPLWYADDYREAEFCFEKKDMNVFDFYRISDENSENEGAVIGNIFFYNDTSVTPYDQHITQLKVYWGPEYKLLDGNNQEFAFGSDKDLVFRASGSLEENFDSVLVDGKEIEDYEATSGSTIIALANNYLNTLSNGEHTLTIRYHESDNAPSGEVKAKFTVSGNPETANGSQMAILIIMASICLCGTGVSLYNLLPNNHRR